MSISRIARVGRVARAGQGGANADPVIVSITINTSSAQITVTMSRPCTGSAGFTIHPSVSPNITPSYDSTVGNDIFYGGGDTMGGGETATLSYTPGDIIGNNGLTLKAFSGFPCIVV